MRSPTHRMYWACALSLPLLGCAPKEYTALRPDRAKWLEADADAAASATDMKEPAILPKTYYAAGQLFEQQGHLHKAIVQYRRAAEAQPDYVPAYNRLGVLLGRVGRHTEAEQALRQAVGMRPEWAFLRNNLGFEYMMQERWMDAEAELRNALRLQPEFARAHNNLGVVLAKQGRFDEALVEFKEAMPESDALYNLGMMYRNQNRYQDAAGAFEHAVSLAPDFKEAKAQLAMVSPGRAPTRTIPAYGSFETTVAAAPVNPIINQPSGPSSTVRVESVAIIHAAEPVDQPADQPVDQPAAFATAPAFAPIDEAPTPVIEAARPDEPQIAEAPGISVEESPVVDLPSVDPTVLLVEARVLPEPEFHWIVEDEPCVEDVENLGFAASELAQESPAEPVVGVLHAAGETIIAALDAIEPDGPCEDEVTAELTPDPIESYADLANDVSAVDRPELPLLLEPAAIGWLWEAVQGAMSMLQAPAAESLSLVPTTPIASQALSEEALAVLCDFSASGPDYFRPWADWRDWAGDFHAGLPFLMAGQASAWFDELSTARAITMITED